LQKLLATHLANNPNAEYIQAGVGALSNSARNTLQLPGTNNLDLQGLPVRRVALSSTPG